MMQITDTNQINAIEIDDIKRLEFLVANEYHMSTCWGDWYVCENDSGDCVTGFRESSFRQAIDQLILKQAIENER